MPTFKFSNEDLAAAIAGFELQKQEIDAQIAEIRKRMRGAGAPSGAPAAAAAPGGKRTLSAEGRARIAEAQRKRWASQRKPGRATQAAPAKQAPKRKLSAAGRKRIIEATKARWARVKAEAAAKSKAVAPKRKRSQKPAAKPAAASAAPAAPAQD
jgi:hypothetical protein